MVLRRVRRLLGLRPPYYEDRQRLYSAIKSGEISETMPYRAAVPKINSILGGDSWTEGPDWVELQMWAEDLGVELKRSEEHTSELQSLAYLVCRLLLEKKKRTLKDNDTKSID